MFKGFAFRGYRSFYGDLAAIGPMSKVHLLAGQNNSGKTNALKFAYAYLPHVGLWAAGGRRRDLPLPSGLDRPSGTNASAAFDIAVAVPRSPEAFQGWFETSTRTAAEWENLFSGLLNDDIYHPFGQSDVAWFQFEPLPNAQGLRLSEAQSGHLKREVQYGQQQTQLKRAFTQLGMQGAESAPTILARRLVAQHMLPQVEMIEAFRQIRVLDEISTTHSGANLIDKLAQLQQPTLDRQEDKRRFQAINTFVQVVLEDENARIEIPHDRETILVHSSGATMPLTHVGTGIQETIIIAAAATVLENALVCIEEPEVHLHPLLQRKLLRYLSGPKTSNQYLIATHSAHFLDAEVASISHVTREHANTRVEAAIEPVHLAKISSDLGYRASDLIQANVIVWVEGPSDRTYIRHWISMQAPELLEGIHYSIMFYGGSLLKELSPDDPAVGDFISLRRINRNLVVVIDSDMQNSMAQLNATKRRVIDGLAVESDGHAWVTAGYTIENYVPLEILEKAANSVHPKSTYKPMRGQWVNPLAPSRFEGRDSPADKAAIAAEAVRAWPQDEGGLWDLQEQIGKLIRYIRAANDMS